MSLEELYDMIATHVAEELKTLKEVILMKPSQGKDPHDGGGSSTRSKKPIKGSGDNSPYPESGKKPKGGG